MVAAAEASLKGRALPLAPADLMKARPDLWQSVKAAEAALTRDREASVRRFSARYPRSPYKEVLISL
jgi:hypothetical protein